MSLHDNQITRHKISLALSPGRDNHPLAATAKMAILIVAVFPSRLSRYTMPRASALTQHPVMSRANDVKQKFASSHV
ncbi:MAG TPA: hypothetical protein VK522_16750 [Pseudolabrys sp.]|nr:hypothetical protein [Pseudolabrys sp.]